MAMVGGGPGAFIGPVHRMAAELDGEIALVAGVFSRDPGRSKEGGARYGIASERSYPTLEALIAGEKSRPDGAQFISVVSPNRHHFEAAEAALKAGLPVICDKPMTATLAEARALETLAGEMKTPMAVTYTYTGYPLVREARERVRRGDLGAVRKVIVEYLQGWLSEPVERGGNKQAGWRTDPEQAGVGGCIGDIGVHAFNLAEFVAQERVVAFNADLASVVKGRALDDDCSMLLRFSNEARGVLIASQVAIGEQNGLRVRVYGERGGLDWRQESPNELSIHKADGSLEILRAGGALNEAAQRASRLPGGHPEGYLEAFANIYRDFAAQLRGESRPSLPGVREGARGVAFIESAVNASRQGAGWVRFEG